MLKKQLEKRVKSLEKEVIVLTDELENQQEEYNELIEAMENSVRMSNDKVSQLKLKNEALQEKIKRISTISVKKQLRALNMMLKLTHIVDTKHQSTGMSS